VFRSENRAGGTEQHVGTLKAEDEAAALEAAEATFACPVTHRLRVALAEG
jgi:1,2-phenylacetyl-CoA epoxidase PaaB subunit